MSRKKSYLMSALGLIGLSPGVAFACACGCGVFDVGTGTMIPSGSGGRVWFEYDYLNQNQNWSGTSAAPAANNPDKRIYTDFFTAGGQYMFNRKWGMEVQVPFWNRDFKTTTDYPNPGDTQLFNHMDLGDIRVKGVYAGFSGAMSTGVTFGFKLATGNFTYPNFDRDTSIGTGSTDLLLGAYHMGDLTPLLSGLPFKWFVNGQWDHAFLTQAHYRPGDEFDGALGTYYEGFHFGAAGTLSPLLQLIGSVRWHDSGANAAPSDTGYQRLLISPGIEYDVNHVSFYGDVELPIYQNVRGNQLIAPVAFKLMVAYHF